MVGAAKVQKKCEPAMEMAEKFGKLLLKAEDLKAEDNGSRG